MCVSFSPDSKRVVSASEDGTLRVWNIDVRYHMSEDPKVLLKVGGVHVRVARRAEAPARLALREGARRGHGEGCPDDWLAG
jgi:WD40 repeat protein